MVFQSKLAVRDCEVKFISDICSKLSCIFCCKHKSKARLAPRYCFARMGNGGERDLLNLTGFQSYYKFRAKNKKRWS